MSFDPKTAPVTTLIQLLQEQGFTDLERVAAGLFAFHLKWSISSFPFECNGLSMQGVEGTQGVHLHASPKANQRATPLDFVVDLADLHTWCEKQRNEMLRKGYYKLPTEKSAFAP